MDLVWFVQNWKQLAVYKDRLPEQVQLRAAAWLENSSFGSQELSAGGLEWGRRKEVP